MDTQSSYKLCCGLSWSAWYTHYMHMHQISVLNVSLNYSTKNMHVVSLEA